MELFYLLEQNPAFFIGTLFVLGLMVGSFLNVVIHRLPLMMERDWQAQYQEYLGESPAEEAALNPCVGCEHPAGCGDCCNLPY